MLVLAFCAVALSGLYGVFPSEMRIAALAIYGVVLLPLGPHDGTQDIVKLTKTKEGLKQARLINVRFVPLLPGQAREL